MPTARFYLPSLEGDLLRLEGAEAGHALRVRRLRTGDMLQLFDGCGGEVDARIEGVEHDALLARVTARRMTAPDPAAQPCANLTIATAIPKGPRAEWMVEKLAELGVAALWPLQAQRSTVDPRPARLEKWRRIVREACKQCGRNDFMQVDEPICIEQLIERRTAFGAMFLCDAAGVALRPADVDRSGAGVLALIGPEGGWTADERTALLEAGARTLRIAPHTLRVETAAIAAAALLYAQTEGPA